MDARTYFNGKKITLMRIGLLGRGVGDAAFLAECGADVLVVDDAPQEQMQPSVDALRRYPNITFKFGPYDLQDFRTCDLVLKGAGTPFTSPAIAEAHAHGVPVRMSADLFAELAAIPIIGITGTRGKSTTTHMIHAILSEAGLPVLLGGNVRGVSTLALLPEVTEFSIGLLELDSWQLQGFGEAKLSPNISIFTTFFPDHLNYYQDMDSYLADKANIFLYQDPDDTLVLGAQCAEIIGEKYGDRIRAHTITTGAHDFRADWQLGIPGEHNRYDAALAVEAARALDIDDAIIQKALENFTGVPGRLNLVRIADEVAYYNDTTATTPEATVAAMEALAERYPGRIVLITGGSDKALDMDPYLDAVKKAKHVALLAGTGTDRVKGELPDAPVFADLASAFADARAHAEPGDVVALSPGFASFGMFRNEYDRGDQFEALVNGL